MDFEKPYKRSVVDSIFNGDREKFRDNVRKTLEANKNGGYKVTSSTFIKMVAGNVKLTSEEFAELKKEVKKAAKEIENEKQEQSQEPAAEKPPRPTPPSQEPKIPTVSRSQDETNRIMRQVAERHEDEELERSGGVDPNDI